MKHLITVMFSWSFEAETIEEAREQLQERLDDSQSVFRNSLDWNVTEIQDVETDDIS